VNRSKNGTGVSRKTEIQQARGKRTRKRSPLRKADILLRGLDLLADYYSLAEAEGPMELSLLRLEREALDHMKSLKRVKSRQEAVRNFVEEIRFAEEVIQKYGCHESMLIQILLEIQKHKNWLPNPVLIWISERLGVPMSRIKQIASFYTAFSLEPQGRHICQLCMGTACHVRGSERLLSRVRGVMNVGPNETDAEQKFTLKTVNCLGCCAMGPIFTVDGEYYSDPSVATLKELVHKYD
jgi:NADH-quinone oxidoreductase subunit E